MSRPAGVAPLPVSHVHQLWAVVLMALVGAVAFLHWWQDAGRGFDHRSINSWREADYTAIARGFVQEDINPLHPRVPWRGDTYGEVEMEAPVLPWLAAAAGRIVGCDDALMRRLASLFALGAVALFGWLALSRLPPLPALFAFAFFVANPTVQLMATSMQPEPVVLFWGVFSVLAALRWHETGAQRWWWITVACVSLALLAKASSAYLLPFCLALVLMREGLSGLLRPRLWLSLAAAIALPLAWYLHGRGIYEDTGLSLGLSDERHLVSLALLADPLRPLIGNLHSEARFVAASVAGALLCVAGLLDRRQIPIVWLAASIGLFYFLSADTSGDDWAWYYHLPSVVPAALLAGAGVAVLLARPAGSRSFPAFALAVAVLCGWALVGEVRTTQWLVAARDGASPVYRRCVGELTAALPPDARLLVRGGRSRDEHGHHVAYSDSAAFVWARRKGANFPSDASADPFAAYANRSPPWFWLARPDDRLEVVDYEGLLRAAQAYPVAQRCSVEEGYALVKLAAL